MSNKPILITVYVYAEHCIQAGQVCVDPWGRFDDPNETDDLVAYNGTRDQIFAYASMRLPQVNMQLDSGVNVSTLAFERKSLSAIIDYLV